MTNTTFTLPTGTKFRTATQRRFVLVAEYHERLELDPSTTTCPRCGTTDLVRIGERMAHRDGRQSSACHALGASTGVVILRRSDSLATLRKIGRTGSCTFIVDTTSGDTVA